MGDNTRGVGDGMLDIFRAYGVEYIFSSPGSEWTTLWEALARAKAEGKGPRFLDARHEDVAVTAAIGYYRQAGKLPVVALHTSVGTLHAAMGLHTALHEHVPMVVLAGESAGYGEMAGPDPGFHWQRGLSDFRGSSRIAEPYVKRSSTVTCREVLAGMLQDACRLALTPPFGPVFLTVPLEFMLGAWPPFEERYAPPPFPTRVNSAILATVAKELVRAERPVLLTEYAGREPCNVGQLVELAESLAVPVVEAYNPTFLNFPRDHVLHQGFESAPLINEADLILLVGNQMPWYPASRRPRKAKIIVVDDDCGHELLHYWGYGVDQIIGGDLGSSLAGLNDCIKKLNATSGYAMTARERRWEECRTRHEQQHLQWQSKAMAAAEQCPIDGRWASLTLGEALPPDTVVFEETITHKSLLPRYLKRNLPGTYYSRASGGLGVGIGTALGLKLAAPDRLVAAVIGDGSFNYNPILAAFGFSQQHSLPILVVILNNNSYAAMKLSHRRYYPDGWSVRTNTFFGTDIQPAPDYAAIAQAFGGYGERVEDPGCLKDSLCKAIHRVNGGQLALIDVIVDPLSHTRP